MSNQIHNSSIYLIEMIDACEKVIDYSSKIDQQEFLKKREPYDAICMQLAHLGEQVKLLEKHSDRIVLRFPDEVDWPAIKALRNRIDHAYATLDADLIWDFAQQPALEVREAVARILKKRFGIQR